VIGGAVMALWFVIRACGLGNVVITVDIGHRVVADTAGIAADGHAVRRHRDGRRRIASVRSSL
jgi:hypothetical protein